MAVRPLRCSLPCRTICGRIFEENGGLRDARAELSAAREALGSVLGGADPDIVELERALAQVRTSTERLQTELHAVILNHYLD